MASLAAWVGLWIAVGAGFVLMTRRGYDYIRGWKPTSAYFLALSIVAGMAFGDTLRHALESFRVHHLGFLLGLIVLQFAVHHVAHRFGRPPVRRIERAPHVYWLRMDARYLVSKTFEILFQQTMLWILVLMLREAGFGVRELTLVAVPVFGIVHVPIAMLVGRFFGIYYFVSSLFAGLIFPYVILTWPDGFLWSLICHWGYYLVSQLLFWDWESTET